MKEFFHFYSRACMKIKLLVKIVCIISTNHSSFYFKIITLGTYIDVPIYHRKGKLQAIRLRERVTFIVVKVLNSGGRKDCVLIIEPSTSLLHGEQPCDQRHDEVETGAPY